VVFTWYVISAGQTSVSVKSASTPHAPLQLLPQQVAPDLEMELQSLGIEQFTVHVDPTMPGEYMMIINRKSKEVRYRGRWPDAVSMQVAVDDSGVMMATFPEASAASHATAVHSSALPRVVNTFVRQAIAVGRQLELSDTQVIRSSQR
jgi:hypothetical protein